MPSDRVIDYWKETVDSIVLKDSEGAPLTDAEAFAKAFITNVARNDKIYSQKCKNSQSKAIFFLLPS